MSSRETILADVRKALGDVQTGKTPGLPPIPQVWPLEGLTLDEKIQRFETALNAVKGEFLCCANSTEAASYIDSLFKSLAIKNVGVGASPKAKEIAGNLHELCLSFAPDNPADASAVEIERLDAAIHGAENLLADTGSCIIAAPNAFERMICYLPPVCIVIADKDAICENLPQAWPDIIERMNGAASNPLKSGEFVIITGPSRTADIEKILILGVHGPKRLIVVAY